MASPREFGVTLPFSHLAADFVIQFYESGLVDSTEGVLLAQIDDLRTWLREGGRQESELASEVAEALLVGESEAQEAASLEGGEAALAAQLGALEEPVEEPLLDTASLKPILQLVVEEADSIQAWSHRETGGDFSASLSFVLHQPLKNPMFKRKDLEEGLKRHGGSALTEKLDGRRVDVEQLSGVINLDLYGEKAPGAAHPENTGVTRVSLEDDRAGDRARLELSFHYPLEWEPYFLLVLEQARKRMNLK